MTRSAKASFTTSADEPVFARILLAGGNGNPAAIVAETVQRRSSANPDIASYAAHTRALLTGDVDATAELSAVHNPFTSPMKTAPGVSSEGRFT